MMDCPVASEHMPTASPASRCTHRPSPLPTNRFLQGETWRVLGNPFAGPLDRVCGEGIRPGVFGQYGDDLSAVALAHPGAFCKLTVIMS